MVLLQAVFAAKTSSAESESSNSTPLSNVIQTHCASCHGGGDEIEGDVDLVHQSVDELIQDAELVRRLIDVLDLEEMPPEDEPPLDPIARRQLVSHLKEI